MKKIIISPYSSKLSNKVNPKNYPYWNEITKSLKSLNYFLIQVGITDEERLRNIDLFKINLDFNTELKELLDSCFCWFSVDNFFHHFAAYYNKPGVVIFTVSDPRIFGHAQNLNLYRGEQYFRKDQFGIWENSEYNKKAFIDPAIVIKKFVDRFECSNKF